LVSGVCSEFGSGLSKELGAISLHLKGKLVLFDEQGAVLDLTILGEVEMIEIGSQIIFPVHSFSTSNEKRKSK
jgi:hypothetical protein